MLPLNALTWPEIARQCCIAYCLREMGLDATVLPHALFSGHATSGPSLAKSGPGRENRASLQLVRLRTLAKSCTPGTAGNRLLLQSLEESRKAAMDTAKAAVTAATMAAPSTTRAKIAPKRKPIKAEDTEEEGGVGDAMEVAAAAEPMAGKLAADANVKVEETAEAEASKKVVVADVSTVEAETPAEGAGEGAADASVAAASSAATTAATDDAVVKMEVDGADGGDKGAATEAAASGNGKEKVGADDVGAMHVGGKEVAGEVEGKEGADAEEDDDEEEEEEEEEDEEEDEEKDDKVLAEADKLVAQDEENPNLILTELEDLAEDETAPECVRRCAMVVLRLLMHRQARHLKMLHVQPYASSNLPNLTEAVNDLFGNVMLDPALGTLVSTNPAPRFPGTELTESPEAAAMAEAAANHSPPEGLSQAWDRPPVGLLYVARRVVTRADEYGLDVDPSEADPKLAKAVLDARVIERLERDMNEVLDAGATIGALQVVGAAEVRLSVEKISAIFSRLALDWLWDGLNRPVNQLNDLRCVATNRECFLGNCVSCYRCEAYFTTKALRPPLHAADPTADWFCPSCVALPEPAKADKALTVSAVESKGGADAAGSGTVFTAGGTAAVASGKTCTPETLLLPLLQFMGTTDMFIVAEAAKILGKSKGTQPVDERAASAVVAAAVDERRSVGDGSGSAEAGPSADGRWSVAERLVVLRALCLLVGGDEKLSKHTDNMQTQVRGWPSVKKILTLQ